MKDFYFNQSGERVEIKKMADPYLYNSFVKYKKRLEEIDKLILNKPTGGKLSAYRDELKEIVESLKAEFHRRGIV